MTKAPINNIELVPNKIDLFNLLEKIRSNSCSLSLLKKDKKSSLKYQNIAKTLPNWITADKDDPGSSKPKNKEITFRWAVLLIGRNSVKPWIKP